jgi:serine/threonine protein kinase
MEWRTGHLTVVELVQLVILIRCIRDLKPENLLMSSPNDDADIKIADFGFAKRCGGLSSLTTPLGSPSFVAPEILMHKAYGRLKM